MQSTLEDKNQYKLLKNPMSSLKQELGASLTRGGGGNYSYEEMVAAESFSCLL